MREVIVSLTVGIVVALGWLVLWTIALWAFDISPLTRTPEDLARRRERLVRMGKARYVLIFGMFGFGLAMGLGLAVAGLVVHDSAGWAAAAVKLVLWTVLFGWWHGARAWNGTFRGEIPFPPPEIPPPER